MFKSGNLAKKGITPMPHVYHLACEWAIEECIGEMDAGNKPDDGVGQKFDASGRREKHSSLSVARSASSYTSL